MCSKIGVHETNKVTTGNLWTSQATLTDCSLVVRSRGLLWAGLMGKCGVWQLDMPSCVQNDARKPYGHALTRLIIAYKAHMKIYKPPVFILTTTIKYFTVDVIW